MTAVQRDIDGKMRSVLFDWLVEVQMEYRLCSETLYLAFHHTDRFLSAVPVQRSKLQLVGVTALMLASKTEELAPPALEEFVYICDKTYSAEEVVKMEALMLKTLHFDVTPPTHYVFLMRFLKCTHADARLASLARVRFSRSLVSIFSRHRAL